MCVCVDKYGDCLSVRACFSPYAPRALRCVCVSVSVCVTFRVRTEVDSTERKFYCSEYLYNNLFSFLHYGKFTAC